MSPNIFHQLGDLEFEWDSEKAAGNLVKHRLSFEEGATVFQDEDARLLEDPDHFDDETRFELLGYSKVNHLLVTVYVVRALRMRIVSVRPATRSERSEYES
jgi:uncharacterized DUF497 family protein